MALDAKQQFRLGFLSMCAEAGLTPDEVREKVAEATELVKQGFDFMQLARYWAGIPVTAGAVGVLGSAALGGAAGYGLSQMPELTGDDVSVDEAKRQELIALMRQHTEASRRRAQRIMHRQPKPASKNLQLF